MNWVKTTYPVCPHLSFPTVSPSSPSMGSFISEAFCIMLALVLVCFSQAIQHTYDITPLWGPYISVARAASDTTDPLPPSNTTQRAPKEPASQSPPAEMHDKRPWEGEGLGSLWFSESETLGISLLWKAFLGIPSQEMQSALLGKNI